MRLYLPQRTDLRAVQVNVYEALEKCHIVLAFSQSNESWNYLHDGWICRDGWEPKPNVSNTNSKMTKGEIAIDYKKKKKKMTKGKKAW